MTVHLWKAYLPITNRVRVSLKDIAWFAQRNVTKECLAAALAVMRHVRRDVIPLKGTVAFLVHDRGNGVPVRAGDKRAFIDATIWFSRKRLSRHWLFVRPYSGDPRDEELFRLSEYYLDILQRHKKLSDIEVLKIVGQHTHYLANMTQLEVT